MQMTFRNYIDNPMGIKSAVFTQRDMFKNLYTNKFDAILLREAGEIKYYLYYDKKKDEYYCHIKIPSEVVPKFYYDVIIQFYTEHGYLRTNNSLLDYYVRFYSNDPAFVFTFLRVFLKNDMFISFLKSKSPNQALKKDPDIRNPYQTPGYVKSLYFAFLFMKLRNLFVKGTYKTDGETFSEKLILSRVEHANKVIKERQEKGEEIERQKKKKDTTTTARSVIKTPEQKSTAPLISKTKKAPLIKKAGTVKKAKTVSMVKKK